MKQTGGNTIGQTFDVTKYETSSIKRKEGNRKRCLYLRHDNRAYLRIERRRTRLILHV